jgi:ABC-type polysaccharide/polyol phosphate transport system ATPase subunit
LFIGFNVVEIILNNVTISYPVYDYTSSSIKGRLINIGTGGKIGSEKGRIKNITALDNVTFSLKQGDFVGLVGHNGAGKSTLLRTVAGIYTPTSGHLTVTGSISTIFEMGAGIDPELSGYENIVRMSMFCGISAKNAKKNIAYIEEFTELGNFLQLPVRTYSSGMVTRLMFAVSTCIKPEILLLDEMFGTGDKVFHEKAVKRMNELVSGAGILMFASHDFKLLKENCNRFLRLEHGRVQEITKDDF